MFDGSDLNSIKDSLVFAQHALLENKHDMPDPVLMYASLNLATNEILFRLSFPLMSREEKEAIKDFVLPKKLKWIGEMFKSVII